MVKGVRVTEWILRVAVFGTFLGHGLLALGVKEGWVPLITSFGLSRSFAISIMPWIGMGDIGVAILVLVWPVRIILVWAMLWALAAGVSRIISGEPVWELVERSAEWGSALALLLMQGLPKKFKDLFQVRDNKPAVPGNGNRNS